MEYNKLIKYVICDWYDKKWDGKIISYEKDTCVIQWLHIDGNPIDKNRLTNQNDKMMYYFDGKAWGIANSTNHVKLNFLCKDEWEAYRILNA